MLLIVSFESYVVTIQKFSSFVDGNVENCVIYWVLDIFMKRPFYSKPVMLARHDTSVEYNRGDRKKDALSFVGLVFIYIYICIIVCFQVCSGPRPVY